MYLPFCCLYRPSACRPQAAGPERQLRAAIDKNASGYLQQQLASGLAVDYRIESETLLMICAREGRLELVRLLVEKGADVNAQSAKGHSAISFASRYGHLAIVQYLLNHGAEVNISNNNGWTPLLKAARGGHLDVVDYLLAHDTDLRRRNSAGLDAIALAAQYGHGAVVKYLKDFARNSK